MTQYVKFISNITGQTVWGPEKTTGQPFLEWVPAQLFRLMDSDEVRMEITGEPDPAQHDATKHVARGALVPEIRQANATVILSPQEMTIDGMADIVRSELARKIADLLLKDGFIIIEGEADGFVGGIRFTATLDVAVPRAGTPKDDGDAL